MREFFGEIVTILLGILCFHLWNENRKLKGNIRKELEFQIGEIEKAAQALGHRPTSELIDESVKRYSTKGSGSEDSNNG